ncbi:MAG: YggS family pyridoxal phosphate-dependent enzyme [Chloroflexi bacterium HGW-Chloroflexi-10]|nr:MAG: YggS family pyridoxal phosphate-dependent enzyme [Chloroflexi bacterium HGW-Chloroflexi-10]
MAESSDIAQNFNKISSEIDAAVRLCKRNPDSVRLIVVTKGQSVERVASVINAGAKFLGENYPEETVEKMAGLGSRKTMVEWHMIGHLQSRKAALVLEHFDFFHALDSRKLAEKLNRSLEGKGTLLKVLLQYNVGGEDSKFGWLADQTLKWPTLIKDFEYILQLKNLKICGIMVMSPFTNNKSQSRFYFEKTRMLRDFFQGRYSEIQMDQLSMGTSHDFIEAIAEGATFLRIGTAIMGDRDYPKGLR